jgi:hypothetical protein
VPNHHIAASFGTFIFNVIGLGQDTYRLCVSAALAVPFKSVSWLEPITSRINAQKLAQAHFARLFLM